MKLLFKGVKLSASKCKPPKFTDKNGKSWNSDAATIDGNPVDLWLDTIWGFYVYFEYQKQWHKVRFSSDGTKPNNSYHFDLFENEKTILTTR